MRLRHTALTWAFRVVVFSRIMRYKRRVVPT